MDSDRQHIKRPDGPFSNHLWSGRGSKFHLFVLLLLDGAGGVGDPLDVGEGEGVTEHLALEGKQLGQPSLGDVGGAGTTIL